VRPEERELDEEIRGHLAVSIHERMERGESPDAARMAALQELGYIPAVRDSMRQVWHHAWIDALADFWRDVRIGFRSLARSSGLATTVVVTLALGIGANAAIFSVVRGVLLRPLVNRDADRLIYIRQSAPGIGATNTTFSVPEIADFRSRTRSISEFGEFSTIEFPMAGIGEPRVVQAGVVNGSYFDVMGLRPVLGRLLDATDDAPDAAPVAVLTHRFWTTSLDRDPAVIGRTIRLGTRAAKIVGVLEPSVPYPAATEIIANIVASPHHLSATMETMRTHRMTELFGRLAPGATLESAREELIAVHAAMMREHPKAYPWSSDAQLTATLLRDQLAAPARDVLLMLLAAAGIVFVIACSNVANLILARSVRRERELTIRAALGASRAALRRTLLAESVVLCSAGAAVGVLLARPLVPAISRYAARFSVRALDVTVDGTMLWVGAALALFAAVVLAYIPRLPSPHTPAAAERATAGLRITPAANRRLQLFAVTQIGLSFVLIAAAGILLTLLVERHSAGVGFDTRNVLAIDVPLPIEAAGTRTIEFIEELLERVERLDGVRRVAAGNVVPWRDATRYGPGVEFAVDSGSPSAAGELPHARLRTVTPGFFAALGVPLLAGRDFTADDRAGGDPVVIVSESFAMAMYPDGDALNRYMWWTNPIFGTPVRRRIVGIVADLDDEHVVPGPSITVYHPLRQMPFGDRLFVHTKGDPYALVGPVRQIVNELAADQPVERAATLADVRTAVLAPERLNAFVFAGFAGLALLIAVVGVAGVLGFSVSARTQELGIRLAVGSSRSRLMLGVLADGAGLALLGIAAGAVGGYALVRTVSSLDAVQMPVLSVIAAAAVLAIAAVLASLMPAARASRVDVMQALRSE
jgi:predicted permease